MLKEARNRMQVVFVEDGFFGRVFIGGRAIIEISKQSPSVLRGKVQQTFTRIINALIDDRAQPRTRLSNGQDKFGFGKEVHEVGSKQAQKMGHVTLQPPSSVAAT
jgi:hypothetical protein